MVDLRIRKVSDIRKEQLENIANHYGITVAAFLKLELMKLIDTYPDHIKNKQKEKSED